MPYTIDSEEKLRIIAENSTAITYALHVEDNGELTPVWTSGNILRLLGWDENDFLNNPSWWASHIHPMDWDDALKNMVKIFDDGYVLHEYRFQKKDHTYCWIRDELKIAIGEKNLVIGSWVINDAHKEVENKLRISEQRFQDFAHSASDWLWELGPDLRFTFFSERFDNVIGRSHDALIGRTRDEIGKPNIDKDKWTDHLATLEAHKPFRDFEYDIQREDGTLVPVRVSGIPIFDADQTFLGYRGTGTDITVEHSAKRQAVSAQKRLADAFESAPAMMGLYDDDDRFIYCNKAYRENFKKIADMLVPGVSVREISRVAAERGMVSGYQDKPEEWAQIRTARLDAPGDPIIHKQADGRWVMTADHKTKDGSTFIIRTDVTGIKNSEDTLRKLSRAVEQSPSAVFITDTKGSIEYVNSKFTDLTGYTAEEAIGQNPRILKSDDTPSDTYTELWTTLLAGKEWRGDIKDRHKDGSYFWAYGIIAPVKDEDGITTHYVATHEDITKRKDAEFAAQDALEQAVIANRAKSELLANMSHELRTPLNAIIGFSDVLKTEMLGPLGHDKYKEYVDDISNSGLHLLELINDILDVSAVEAGKLKLHEQNVDVGNLLNASVRLVQHRANQGSVRLVTDISSGQPMLYIDERRLKQILLNLLSNAIKFTPPGGVVTSHASLDDKSGYTFTITDTGIGMDKMELEKAVTKFGQVDGGLNRKHEGTGLGLPLTQGLVELHGGVLDVSSEKGVGTVVTVKFPKERVIVGA